MFCVKQVCRSVKGRSLKFLFRYIKSLNDNSFLPKNLYNIFFAESKLESVRIWL